MPAGAQAFRQGVGGAAGREVFGRIETAFERCAGLVGGEFDRPFFVRGVAGSWRGDRGLGRGGVDFKAVFGRGGVDVSGDVLGANGEFVAPVSEAFVERG